MSSRIQFPSIVSFTFIPQSNSARQGWSGRYSACPDDEVFRFLASAYATAHRKMWHSREFPGGITNGAAVLYPCRFHLELVVVVVVVVAADLESVVRAVRRDARLELPARGLLRAHCGALRQ
jgi:hypothetical protein